MKSFIYYRIIFYFFNESTEGLDRDQTGDKYARIGLEDVDRLKEAARKKMAGTNYEDYSLEKVTKKEFTMCRMYNRLNIN